LPIINIKDSTRLGDSFDKFKNIRDLVHNKKNIEIIELLTNHAAYVTIPEGVGKKNIISEKATDFLTGFVRLFPEIKASFSEQHCYNRAMDFVCQLDSGDFVLVEILIFRLEGSTDSTSADRAFLAYVADFYGNN
jgi:hypothetical protein